MSNINLSNFETGDNSFEDVYIYGKLNYNFENDDLKFGNATFTGAINATSQTITGGTVVTENSIATGIATVGTALYVNGKLHDGDGDFGSAGQVLSSDGTDTKWINTSDTNVGSASNVGTNANATNTEQFVTFVGSSIGNNPIRVDAVIKYNPSTNRLTAGSYAGDGSALTGIEAFVTGMIILWSGAANAIPTGFVLCNGSNNTPDLRGRFVVGYHDSNGDYDVDDTGGAETVTLSIAQMPNHKHTTTFDGHKFFPGDGSTSISYGGAGGYPATTFSMDNTGGGGAHENRPPYYALCYIMKT